MSFLRFHGAWIAFNRSSTRGNRAIRGRQRPRLGGIFSALVTRRVGRRRSTEGSPRGRSPPPCRVRKNRPRGVFWRGRPLDHTPESLARALRSKRYVDDFEFDLHLSPAARVASSCFWTPLAVARRAAELFAAGQPSRQGEGERAGLTCAGSARTSPSASRRRCDRTRARGRPPGRRRSS